jgi:anti-sigma-K factor RskA
MTDTGPVSPADLAAAYALGALGPEEKRAFEAYLASSADARGEVAEYREVAALLAAAGSTAGPSPSLRDRVIAGAPRAGAGPPRAAPIAAPAAAPGGAARRSWTLPAALAACLVAAIALGVRQTRLSVALAAKDSALAADRAALDSARRGLAEAQATLERVLEPGTRMFQLTESGNPDPGVQIFWNRNRNEALLHAYRLRPPASGRTYQLWFIRDGKPVPSVTFRSSGEGGAIIPHIPVPTGGTITAAAITEEPQGGSPQPTTPVLLVGSLGG